METTLELLSWHVQSSALQNILWNIFGYMVIIFGHLGVCAPLLVICHDAGATQAVVESPILGRCGEVWRRKKISPGDISYGE